MPTAFGDLIAVHVPYNRLDDVINLCNSDEFPLSFWPARLNDTKINIIHDFVLSEGLHVVLRKNQILSHQYEVPMSELCLRHLLKRSTQSGLKMFTKT